MPKSTNVDSGTEGALLGWCQPFPTAWRRGNFRQPGSAPPPTPLPLLQAKEECCIVMTEFGLGLRDKVNSQSPLLFREIDRFGGRADLERNGFLLKRRGLN